MKATAHALRPSLAAAASKLERLKAAPRKPGEASFFWWEPQFQCEAVKVLPGEFFVAADEVLIMTTLGSCVAACLWDRDARIGGMNHFLLPDGQAGSGRFGAYAMELLINEMLKRGAARASMEAKVFGGGRVVAGMDTANVGERNTRFVLDYLKAERIPVVSQDVQGIYPRKVCFLPASGKALVKRLAATQAAELLAQERLAMQRALPAGKCGGAISVF